MKYSLLLITGITSILATSAMAQSVEKKVALKIPATKTYVGIAPGGALSLKGKDITGARVFALVDANGGELADGDAVQIKHTSEGGKTTYWSEAGAGITRIFKSDASTQFKIKKAATGVSLQAASGKFLAATAKDQPLSLAEGVDKAAVFEVVENPTVAPAKDAKAAGATEKEAE